MRNRLIADEILAIAPQIPPPGGLLRRFVCWVKNISLHDLVYDIRWLTNDVEHVGVCRCCGWHKYTVRGRGDIMAAVGPESVKLSPELLKRRPATRKAWSR